MRLHVTYVKQILPTCKGFYCNLTSHNCVIFIPKYLQNFEATSTLYFIAFLVGYNIFLHVYYSMYNTY